MPTDILARIIHDGFYSRRRRAAATSQADRSSTARLQARRSVFAGLRRHWAFTSHRRRSHVVLTLRLMNNAG
ncbi:MAG: hypothetical protein ABW047_14015 [Nitrospiraceae bacterium]